MPPKQGARSHQRGASLSTTLLREEWGTKNGERPDLRDFLLFSMEINNAGQAVMHPKSETRWEGKVGDTYRP
jgi:hypothetical protein